jgi:ERCC4-type nuclease
MLKYYKYKNDAEIKKVLKTIEIIVDSREQVNDHILKWFDKKKIPYRIEKLNAGDYSFCLPQSDVFNIPRDLYFTNDIAIERKANLDELATNLTKNRTRFQEEFALFNGKMHLIIENNTYSDIIEKNYRSVYKPESYLPSLHTFIARYDLNCLFMSKEYSAQYIYYTFYYYLRELVK